MAGGDEAEARRQQTFRPHTMRAFFGFALGRYRNARRHRAKEDKAGGDDGGVNAPLWRMWKLLRPSWATMFRSEAEIVGMVAICLCRAVELRLKTGVARRLAVTLVSRERGDFRIALGRMALVNLGGSWLRILYGYLQARLTWKWRRKLTLMCHDAYFSGLNYYMIGEGGSRGQDKMSDGDTRIHTDLAQAVDGMAKTFSDALFSCTTGVFYTVEIWRVFGLLFAAAPYIYLFGAFIMVNKIAPVMKTWREIGRFRAEAWGMYRFAFSKMDLQAESIASLKGAAAEHKHLRELYALHRYDLWRHHVSYWRFGIVNVFFVGHWGVTDVVMSAFCIGRGIVSPQVHYSPEDSPEVKLEKMASERSDVELQLLLFQSAMDAAQTAIAIVRELQQVVGTVERVTDFLALLEKVGEKKREELGKSVVSGDSIAFENVDIYTPADVLLVKDLSFKLEVGQSLLLTGHNGAGK